MTNNKKRIAVLGAGPMGLAVAYQLARDGHEPVVFEADDRVGGMTACFDFEGLQIERYYHERSREHLVAPDFVQPDLFRSANPDDPPF